MNLVIESGTTLTLKVGGSFINLNAGGVYISGPMILLNSGGAAGTGAGSTPALPLSPHEADRAVPGKMSKPKPKRVKYSRAARCMKKAAKKRLPFVEITPSLRRKR